MKTVSVKEVASALGVTPRAVIYRLEKGDLKGVRTPNQYGVQEWRIYPTKEIADKLKPSAGSQPASQELNFQPVDAEAIEAEDVTTYEEPTTEERAASGRPVELEHLEIIAEKLMKPLAERIEAQAMALAEKDRIIEEQSRQLKLLPDLQKKAEEERKDAELKSLEVEALNKQIAALQEQIELKVSPEVEVRLEAEKATKEEELVRLKSELEEERVKKQTELAELQEKLNAFEEYRKLAEDAQRKVDELQMVIEERRRNEELSKTAQEEKEAETAAIKEQLQQLSQQLEKVQRPWWKKFFGLD